MLLSEALTLDTKKGLYRIYFQLKIPIIPSVEKRTYGPEHALIEAFRALLQARYGRQLSKDEVAREARLVVLDITGNTALQRPKNYSEHDQVITADMLQSLPQFDLNYNGTLYIPSERRVAMGTNAFQFGVREASIFHPLIAYPNKLMIKDLFIQTTWHYPPEITKLGRPTFNSGLNRIRRVLNEIESILEIKTIPGVGLKLK